MVLVPGSISLSFCQGRSLNEAMTVPRVHQAEDNRCPKLGNELTGSFSSRSGPGHPDR